MRTSRKFAPLRLLHGQRLLFGVLILLLSVPTGSAQTDFSAFWKRFKSAVIAGDKAAVVEMIKFPVSMSYGVKAVKNKENFLRRYDEIFKGEANATCSCAPTGSQDCQPIPPSAPVPLKCLPNNRSRNSRTKSWAPSLRNEECDLFVVNRITNYRSSRSFHDVLAVPSSLKETVIW